MDLSFLLCKALAIRSKDVIRKVLAFKDIRIQLGQEKMQSVEDCFLLRGKSLKCGECSG